MPRFAHMVVLFFILYYLFIMILKPAWNIVRKHKFNLICIFLLLLGFFVLSLIFSSGDSSPYQKHVKMKKIIHGLCIIVPFRDRFEEMLEFVPYMVEFLIKKKIRHHIFIVNQIDSYRFNRGALINVGFLHSTNNTNCDYIAMHDIDLLPVNENISYAYPKNYAFHVASPSLHPIYHYETFIGGILLINKRLYTKVDGLSNRYWGWGMEDDEFYLRLKSKKISILRPGGLSTDRTNTFRHIHGPKRKRDQSRCFNQVHMNYQRDRMTGLHNVDYRISSVYRLQINNHPLTLINVYLACDKILTPWCSCEL